MAAQRWCDPGQCLLLLWVPVAPANGCRHTGQLFEGDRWDLDCGALAWNT